MASHRAKRDRLTKLIKEKYGPHTPQNVTTEFVIRRMVVPTRFAIKAKPSPSRYFGGNLHIIATKSRGESKQ